MISLPPKLYTLPSASTISKSPSTFTDPLLLMVSLVEAMLIVSVFFDFRFDLFMYDQDRNLVLIRHQLGMTVPE